MPRGTLDFEGEIDDLVLARKAPALDFAVLEAQRDGFADVPQGLFASATLADAARDERTLGYEKSVFTGPKDNR